MQNLRSHPKLLSYKFYILTRSLGDYTFLLKFEIHWLKSVHPIGSLLNTLPKEPRMEEYEMPKSSITRYSDHRLILWRISSNNKTESVNSQTLKFISAAGIDILRLYVRSEFKIQRMLSI